MANAARRARATVSLFRRLLQEAAKVAQRIVTDEMRRLERRGERSIQDAVVTAVTTDDDGTSWADVTCQPSGLTLTAKMGTPTRGIGQRVQVGDEVVIAAPRGDTMTCAIIVAVIPNPTNPQPTDMDADHVSIDAGTGRVKVRGSLIEFAPDDSPAFVARQGDTVTITASPWLAWFAAIGVDAGIAAPGAAPTGTITTGSTKVKAGG